MIKEESLVPDEEQNSNQEDSNQSDNASDFDGDYDNDRRNQDNVVTRTTIPDDIVKKSSDKI